MSLIEKFNAALGYRLDPKAEYTPTQVQSMVLVATLRGRKDIADAILAEFDTPAPDQGDLPAPRFQTANQLN
jgi:hypothetical protein